MNAPSLVLARAVVRPTILTRKRPIGPPADYRPSRPRQRVACVGNGHFPNQVVEGIAHVADHITDSKNDISLWFGESDADNK